MTALVKYLRSPPPRGADVALHDGEGAAVAGDDQRPRAGHELAVTVGRADEEEVDRLVECRVVGDVDEHAAAEEGGVEGSERVFVDAGVAGEVLLHDVRVFVGGGQEVDHLDIAGVAEGG